MLFWNAMEGILQARAAVPRSTPINRPLAPTTEPSVARITKRLLDLVLSLAFLCALAPLFLLIALVIVLDTSGPPFYISPRIGKVGRSFSCFKFRTMIKGAENFKAQLKSLNERDAVFFKLSDDPRTTRVGKILRRYSLDELPQLLNVLRGEMSLVGPRPSLASEVGCYAPEHHVRLAVTPGITGLWQVQARQNPSFASYVALDAAYVENWSLWLDLKILAQTPRVVLQGTGR